jgi:hypothetical protein
MEFNESLTQLFGEPATASHRESPLVTVDSRPSSAEPLRGVNTTWKVSQIHNEKIRVWGALRAPQTLIFS